MNAIRNKSNGCCRSPPPKSLLATWSNRVPISSLGCCCKLKCSASFRKRKR